MASILITISIIVNFINSKLSAIQKNKLSKKIGDQFTGVKRPMFLGIKAYESKTSGEIADHVILTNFSYKNAVKRDMKKLEKLTDNQKIDMGVKSGLGLALINEAANKLLNSFADNLNKETQSAQSKAQQDAFTRINEAVKVHNETGQIYIYGLHISKKVHVAGEYKTVNSRALTLAQDYIKKELNFSTNKYRQFIVDKDMLSAVNLNGETFTL